MLRILLPVLLVLSGFTPLIAQAQSSPTNAAPAQAPASTSVADPAVVGEIIVTAQRRSERLQDVPISITAQTGPQLEKAGVDSTRGLEQVAPGMTFASQGAWAEPNIRGVSTGNSGAGEENPIAVYVDGVYQVSQIASLFQLPDVAQIEVLKGPQGTLFGRNAEGGAIQIQTRDPSFTSTGNLTASYGYFTGGGDSRSSPDYEFKGFLTTPLVDNLLAGSISFLTQYTDGYLNNIATGDRDGSIKNNMVRAKLLLTPNDSVKFLLSGWFSKTVDDANTAANALNGLSVASAVNTTVTPNVPYYPGAIIASAPWTTAHDYPTYIHTENVGASLRSTFTFDAGSLSSLTAYNRVIADVRVDVGAGYLPAGPVRDGCYSQFACIDYLITQPASSESEELVWASRKHGPISYVTGLFLFRSDEHQGANINQVVLPGVFDNDDRVVSTSYAGFAEGNYDIVDNLTLILGARYSYEKKSGSFAAAVGGPYKTTATPHWDSLTPRASLRYRLDDLSNVYFTYSKGFKSGVLNLSAPFNVVAPESLAAYEVGYKRNTSVYSIAASAFYYDYKDLQVQTFNGLYASTNNAASAKISGFDFDSSLRVTSDFQIRLAGAFLPTAKYDHYDSVSFFVPPAGPFGFANEVGSASGKRLPKSPKLTATVSGDYSREIPWGALDATVSLYYSDKYFWETGYRVQTLAHKEINAQVSLNPGDSKVKIALWGKNLANSAYIQGLVESALADLTVYGPPREVGVSIAYTF